MHPCSENPSAENERGTKRRRTVKTGAVKKTVKKTEVKRTVKKPEVSLCELRFYYELWCSYADCFICNLLWLILSFCQEAYIARVEQLAKLKQKQDEDKADVRLHCFRSAIATLLMYLSTLYVFVLMLTQFLAFVQRNLGRLWRCKYISRRLWEDAIAKVRW